MSVIADLPPGKHNLLVKLSGGADSSIVYYAVCDKFKNRDDINIICITLDTDLKNNYINSAKRIIEIVADLTGKRPYKHYTKLVPNSMENYVNGQEDLQKLANHHDKIFRMYSGITMNPPVAKLKEFATNNHERLGFPLSRLMYTIDNRDKERDVHLTHPHFDDSGFLFAGGDKKTVKELYDKYDMMEKLYPYTFSCETAPYFRKDINGLRGEPIHCGYCFFCLERWYGFGRLT